MFYEAMRLLRRLYYRLFTTYKRLELRKCSYAEGDELIKDSFFKEAEGDQWQIAIPEEDKKLDANGNMIVCDNGTVVAIVDKSALSPPGIHPAFFSAMLARTERIEYGYKLHETAYAMTDDQLATMRKALGLEKDKEYRPYCLKDGCDYPRMFLTAFGFQCPTCHNKIGFDLTHHA